MKPVERFFRKYFLSMAGIIVLFLLLNAVLIFSVLIWAWQTTETKDFSLNEICDHIVMDEEGRLNADEGLPGLLEDDRTLPASAREQAACIRKHGERTAEGVQNCADISGINYFDFFKSR